MKNNKISVGDIVIFQAYEDNTPVEGRVKRKGTLLELGKLCIDKTDTRIFHELETIGDNPFVFTVTTDKWLAKK